MFVHVPRIFRALQANKCIHGHAIRSLQKFEQRNQRFDLHTRHFSNQFREIMPQTSGIFHCKHNIPCDAPSNFKMTDFTVFSSFESRFRADEKKENFFLAVVAKKLKEIKFRWLCLYFSRENVSLLAILVKRLEKRPILTDQSQTARALRKLSRGPLLSNNPTQNR